MEFKTYRINVRVSERLKKYFELKSKETGVSQSSLMALALEEYVDQKTMLDFAKTVERLEQREKIKESTQE